MELLDLNPSQGLTRDNYFGYTEHDNKPVINHSLLKNLFAHKGGSIGMMEYALGNEMEKYESDALRLGTIIHAWLEDPTNVAADFESGLSQAQMDVVKLFYDNHGGDKVVDGDLHSTVEECNLDQLKDELVAFFFSDEVNNMWQPKWKKDTKADKLIEQAGAYWDFLRESNGKIVIPKPFYDTVTRAIEAIKTSGVEYVDENLNIEIHREVPILWYWDVDIPCKSMADKILVNHTAKVIQPVDYKSTSEPIDTFLGKMVPVESTPDAQGRRFVYEEWRQGPAQKYSYYTQEAFYDYAIKQWAKDNKLKDYTILPMQFIVIETIPPYRVDIKTIGPHWRDWGKSIVRDAMTNVDFIFRRKKYYEEEDGDF